MLDFSQHTDEPYLRLLILHDDPDREFAYTTGAEHALDQANRDHGERAQKDSSWVTGVLGQRTTSGMWSSAWSTWAAASVNVVPFGGANFSAASALSTVASRC
ncbi:MAG TPA: hypothetical protein VIT42_18995 [Microlunatus sp.]